MADQGLQPHPPTDQPLITMRKPAMARSATIAFLAVLALATPHHAHAQPAPPWADDETNPSDQAIADLIRQMQAANCRSDDCAAVETIADSLAIVKAARNASPKGNPATFRAQMNATLLDRTRLFPAICNRLYDLADQYGGPLIETDGEIPNMLALYQIAMLIDERQPRHCLSHAITALLPEAEERNGVPIIAAARRACLIGPWRGPGCERIRRPLRGRARFR